MECATYKSQLAQPPNFADLDGAEGCLAGHSPSTTQTFEPGQMISTLHVSRSAAAGCPWCEILWQAMQRVCSGHNITPSDQDYLFWRYDGESFFEPWVWVDNKVCYKIDIYTKGKFWEGLSCV